MNPSIGILAFGSLINSPGAEIEAALIGRKLNVCTPFGVEFARSSIGRGGAPTLVPVQQGGRSSPHQLGYQVLRYLEAETRLFCFCQH